MRPMDLIVLSPHLDDAVFSVGGRMSRLAAQGKSVLVVTFFTSGPDAALLLRRLRPFVDYAGRWKASASPIAGSSMASVRYASPTCATRPVCSGLGEGVASCRR
jgi:hypothetical protein